MSIDTKGFLFGENKENFSIEKLVQYLDNTYEDVKIRHGKNLDVIYFKDDQDNRSLYVFEEYTSYTYENYPKLKDNSIILLDLCCWGNSVKIMKGILKEFGGGYLLENDCNDDWEMIISNMYDEINKNIIISNITKIMTELCIDNKKALGYYKSYRAVKKILEKGE